VLKLARGISSSGHFFDTILVLLVITALCMGAEAMPSVAAHYSGPLSTVLVVLQAAFVLEITIRVVAYLPRPQDYFRKFWNSFDFIVVALSLIPAIGGLGLISRLLRLARLVRIVSVSGALRSFTSGRTHGIAAVISAILMVGLLWYVMALGGFYLFAASPAGHWESLASALTNVGALLVLQNIAATFTGIAPGSSWPYMTVLYAAELAIVVEMLSHLGGFRRPIAGDA
jgi:voltage-gated sodium channel